MTGTDELLASARPAYNQSLGYGWSSYVFAKYQTYYVPPPVFALLAGGVYATGLPGCKCYPNEEAAMNALRAAVNLHNSKGS